MEASRCSVGHRCKALQRGSAGSESGAWQVAAIAFGQVCVYDMDSEGYVVWYDDCSRCYRAGIQPVVLLPPYIEQLQQWITSGMGHNKQQQQ